MTTRPQFVNLTRHHVQNLPDVLSPSLGFHSCRFALLGAFHSDQDYGVYETFFATGRHIYSIPVPVGRPNVLDECRKGKGGVFVPSSGLPINAHNLLPLAHRSEIQHLVVVTEGSSGVSNSRSDGVPDESCIIASVDRYGRATVSRITKREKVPNQILRKHDCADTKDVSPLPSHPSSSWHVEQAYQVQPPDMPREGGWSGLAIAQSHAAIARYYAQDVSIFDGEVFVRTYNTIYPPTSIQLLTSDFVAPESPGTASPACLVAVSEGPFVSIWDLRSAGKKPIVQLGTSPHNPHFYATATHPEHGWIAATGADRSVSIWDTKTWRIVQRWGNCVKYEATSLHFSQIHPSYCYVAGMDYEVVLGEWAGDKRRRFGGGTRESDAEMMSFRGDGRWLGLSLRAEKTEKRQCDVLAGISAKGQVYVGEFA